MVSEPSMADSSTSNGPQSPSPQLPSPLLLLSNMSNLMSIKLDSLNYMVWKLQLTTILEAYSMIDHIDGSVQKPSQYLVDAEGNLTTRANPSFLSWKKRDKALLTLIYSTLSPPVLSMVVGLNSAQEVWNTLETRFTSTAPANVLNLKLELQSVKKGTDSINAFPKNTPSFNSTIRTRDDSLTFEKLSVLLQTEEISINESSEINSALAMFVSNTNRQNNGNSNFNRGRGRNHYSRGGRGGGRTSNFYPQNQFSQNQFSGSQGSPSQGAQSAFHGKNPPTKLAAMANAFNLNITQGTGDTWLTDSGASDHITANLNNLNQPTPFKGPEQDLPTGRVLYQGLSENGVYPIHSSSNAFLHGILKEEVYMSQPQGYTDPQNPHYVCKLHKSIYGLKQAPRAWFERFTGQLLQFGFVASTTDYSLFIYRTKTTIAYLLLYVDDIVLTSNTPTFFDQLIQHLSSVFELKDLGPLHYFLVIQVPRDSVGLNLSQAKYATALLHKHNMFHTKPISTPCTPNTRLFLHSGALHYLTFTRPDLSFAVHQVYQYMASPTLFILWQLREFSDDRRSTFGLLVYLGPNPITWSAKKQLTVSRSSTESEYRALALASAELCWLQTLLKDLGVFISTAPILWCDNIFALVIAFNPVFHARTKHIEVDFHFVRERVLRKDLAVKFVSTLDQLADIFTKSLPTLIGFSIFAAISWLLFVPLSLRRDVEDRVLSYNRIHHIHHT
uniref:Reverse transcriptase Ty1/copia-type domain-containing protein n=1 Tax=Fagus sylvatica TaxID=28930 RepID=A0A2N9EX53_FAGSY